MIDVILKIEVINPDFIHNFKQPAIVFVGLPLEGSYPKSFSEEEGWTPGARHSVVVMEVFARESAVLCGIDEAKTLLAHVLAPRVEEVAEAVPSAEAAEGAAAAPAAAESSAASEGSSEE